MTLFKNIFGRIYALWAMVMFVVTLLLIFLPVWLCGVADEPKRSRILHNLFDVWMKAFFTLVFIRRIFKGRENFRKGEAYVVVCNHNSLFDPPLSSPGIPGANKTIAKSEMARIPLFGIIYKRGSVLVDRKSDSSRKESYSKMKEVLKLGLHMCIYPEGTRNRTNEPLTRFHDGAFRLAVDTGKAVIPSLLFNTRKVLPPGKPFYAWPHKVEMHFLPEVSSSDKTVQQLKDEVFAIMTNYLIHHGTNNS